MFFSLKAIKVWHGAMIFEKEIQNISRRGFLSANNAEFGHFTLLFCRGRQNNIPRIVTHVHSHFSVI